MNILLQALGVLFFCLHTTFAFAGHEVGNGGHVIQCEGRQTILETLDLFEAQRTNNMYLNDFENMDWFEIIEKIQNKLDEVDTIRAEWLRKMLVKFHDSAMWVDRLELVFDSNSPQTHPSCKKIQAAIQFNDRDTKDTLYYIDLNVWNRLTDIHKAALVLHEVFYTKFILRYGHQNSFVTREYVALIFSSMVYNSNVGDIAYISSLREFFSDYDYQGFIIDPSTLRFDNEGRLRHARASTDHQHPLHEGRIIKKRTIINFSRMKDH